MNKLNVELNYRASLSVNVELPEGYTIDDVKSVGDGKWGRALIIMKDNTEILSGGEDDGYDFKWADEVYAFDEEGEELDNI